MSTDNLVSLLVDAAMAYPKPGCYEEFVDPGAPVYQAVAKAVAWVGHPGLQGLVHPGDRVLIKPNWVSDRHPLQQDQVFGNITHGAVLAALADMALRRAGPDGEVIIGEVTTQEANFARLCELTGMWQVAGLLEERYGRGIDLMDLRSQIAVLGPDGLVQGLRRAPGLADDDYPFGDPTGYARLDLGAQSEHAGRDDLAHLLRVTDYTFTDQLKGAQADETVRAHQPDRHSYYLPRLVLSSDVFICVPKLKTHVKAGVTLALKNLIGINARKAWIPHRKEGSTAVGGDEWPDEETIAAAPPALQPHLVNVADKRDANWYGNDTLWRTILDLNKILRYAGLDGTLAGAPQRRYLAVIDGIEGSDGPGPTQGRHRRDGIVAAGRNPVYLDTVVATAMGFDWRALPHIARGYGLAPALRLVDGRPEDIVVRAEPARLADWISLTRAEGAAYQAPPGWLTRIELP